MRSTANKFSKNLQHPESSFIRLATGAGDGIKENKLACDRYIANL